MHGLVRFCEVLLSYESDLVTSSHSFWFLLPPTRFTEKSEEGSGMAYISSWDESNPGGGKDRVALFIERSKMDIVACRDSLGSVIRILELQ